MMRLAAALALTVCVLAGGAQAQTSRGKAEPPPPNPSALDVPAPPYEMPLLRLAELLGSLTYLRDLCGFGDGGDFRARMGALLDSEAGAGVRRDRIAGYFNRGFREYELMHRSCTPVSREVIRRAMAEAGTVARNIGSRFGGT